MTLTIPPRPTGPARLVTARSYLIDRFVPDCEIVALPAKTVAGGTVRLGLGGRPDTGAALPRPRTDWRGRLRRWAARFGPPAVPVALPPGRTGFDCRRNSPQNWAHFLNNHLPVLFLATRRLGLDLGAMVLILPAGVPGYILGAAALFGLEVLVTDAPVTGPILDYAVDPWTAIRAGRLDWVRAETAVAARLAAAVAAAPPPPGRRLFLARRKGRALSNHAEIEAALTARGFVTVYPETLPPAAQFGLFAQAEAIVAIHGAALAPLLYRPAGASPLQLIELLPCGHMSDVYRVMADEMGLGWVGVRGRLKPEYVRPAYRLDRRFDRFSLDPFSIDPVALDLALDLALDMALAPAPPAGANPRS